MYTKSERTVKKYIVGNAVESAHRRLRAKYGKDAKLCVNAVSRLSLSDPITLEELNKLAEKMYDDTVYHDYGMW